MGFDLIITCSFNLCPNTGRPYYWSFKDGVQHMGMPDILVPDHYRKFIHQRGEHFRMYISRFESDYPTVFEMSVSSFRDGYPKWSDILLDVRSIDCEWTKIEHDAFLSGLEWFSSQDVQFSIQWSS